MPGPWHVSAPRRGARSGLRGLHGRSVHALGAAHLPQAEQPHASGSAPFAPAPSRAQVRTPPRIETPEERAHFAALEAAASAFEAKMGTGSGVRAGRARR